MISGFSLLEVLIALFILTFSLLTLNAVETSILQRSIDVYFTNLAEVQNINMAECMKVSSQDLCLDPWNNENAKLISNATGSIKKLTSSYKISLCWLEHLTHDKTCEYLNV